MRLWKSDLPEMPAESINVSERGIFFETDREFRLGDAVEILLLMPKEVTGEAPMDWRCTGSVMHVQEPGAGKRKRGVGVRFECYEVARPDARRGPGKQIPPSRFGLEAARTKTGPDRR